MSENTARRAATPAPVRSAHTLATVAAAEIAALVEAVDPSQLDQLVDATMSAPVLYVAGHGRSGLVARAWAMRLMHLGVTVHVVGDTLAPAFPADALLICVSATGTTGSSVTQASRARHLGGTVAALTAAGGNALAQLADVVVEVPARRVVATVQHAGSLFEQTCLVIADAVCGALQLRLGLTTAELDSRHANLQ
jgi:6-phospho-3-hexuloisomerase